MCMHGTTGLDTRLNSQLSAVMDFIHGCELGFSRPYILGVRKIRSHNDHESIVHLHLTEIRQKTSQFQSDFAQKEMSIRLPGTV